MGGSYSCSSAKLVNQNTNFCHVTGFFYCDESPIDREFRHVNINDSGWIPVIPNGIQVRSFFHELDQVETRHTHPHRHILIVELSPSSDLYIMLERQLIIRKLVESHQVVHGEQCLSFSLHFPVSPSIPVPHDNVQPVANLRNHGNTNFNKYFRDKTI